LAQPSNKAQKQNISRNPVRSYSTLPEKNDVELLRVAEVRHHKNRKYRSAEGENGFSIKTVSGS
jgi:hypothetical protein